MPAMLNRTAIITVCGAALAAFAAEPQRPAFPAFEAHRIDNIGTQLGQTCLVDVVDQQVRPIRQRSPLATVIFIAGAIFRPARNLST